MEMLYPHVNCQHSLQTQQMLLLQVPGVVMQPSCAHTKQKNHRNQNNIKTIIIMSTVIIISHGDNPPLYKT